MIRILRLSSLMAAGMTLAVVVTSACTQAAVDLASDDDDPGEALDPDTEGAGRLEDSAARVRRLIGQQIGGIEKLKVAAEDAGLPLPRQPDGTVNPRYQTTEAKRYLGKLLFHDPIRTARIDPAFGGVLATKQSGSCGSCHLGEAAGKAGAVLNFNVGGEGRGYTDEHGRFVIRRRARANLRSSGRSLCSRVTRASTRSRR